jgi:hypothetical protein
MGGEQKLADRLHLSNCSCVLEIGPGSGFFSAQKGKCFAIAAGLSGNACAQVSAKTLWAFRC